MECKIRTAKAELMASPTREESIVAKNNVEVCGSCRRVIAVNETPCLWQGDVVCAQCRAGLEAGAAVMPKKPLMARTKETYRRHPILMAIATGAAAAVVLLLVAILVVWISWFSGQALRGIKAGVQGANGAIAAVLPVPTGSIHGRVWWRTSAGVMHLGRDKSVWLIRREVSRAAVLAAINQPKLHAALVARVPVLEADCAKEAAAKAAYDRAKASPYNRARAAYYRARMACNWAYAAYGRAMMVASNNGEGRLATVAAYRKLKATYAKRAATKAAYIKAKRAPHYRVVAAYIKAKTAYYKAKAAHYKRHLAAIRRLLAGHFPPQMGTLSAIQTIAMAYLLHGDTVGSIFSSNAIKATATETKTDFKGRYRFTDVAAGRYFFLLSVPFYRGHLPGDVDYGHPVTVAGGENIRADINLGKAQFLPVITAQDIPAVSSIQKKTISRGPQPGGKAGIASPHGGAVAASKGRGPQPGGQAGIVLPHGGAVVVSKGRGPQPVSRGAQPVGRGASVGGGGSIVTPPPNPIMPRKYQSAWPAHLVNPKFQLTIRRNGTVANVKVLISSGHAGIDQAIIKALMQARFLPNIIGGKPVQSKFVIRYQITS